MEAKKNIASREELQRSGLRPGDQIHLGVVGPGQVTDNAWFLRENETGIDVRGPLGHVVSIRWKEIIEFWPIRDERKELVV